MMSPLKEGEFRNRPLADSTVSWLGISVMSEEITVSGDMAFMAMQHARTHAGILHARLHPDETILFIRHNIHCNSVVP